MTEIQIDDARGLRKRRGKFLTWSFLLGRSWFLECWFRCSTLVDSVAPPGSLTPSGLRSKTGPPLPVFPGCTPNPWVVDCGTPLGAYGAVPQPEAVSNHSDPSWFVPQTVYTVTVCLGSWFLVLCSCPLFFVPCSWFLVLGSWECWLRCSTQLPGCHPKPLGS